MKYPKTTAAVAGGLATGGLGGVLAGGLGALAAQQAGRAAARQTRDFGKVARTSTRRFFGLPERTKEGDLKTGQSSWAQRAAQATIGQIDPSVRASRERAAAAATAAALPGGVAANLNNDALSATRLQDPRVKRTLGHPNVNLIAQHTGDVNVLRAIVRDKDYIRELGDPERIALRAAMQANNLAATGLQDRDQRDAINDLLKTIDDINKE